MSQHIKVCDSVRSVNEDLLYSPTRSHLIDSSAQLQIAPLLSTTLHYSLHSAEVVSVHNSQHNMAQWHHIKQTVLLAECCFKVNHVYLIMINVVMEMNG